MTDFARLFVINSGAQRQRCHEAIADLQLGTHKVVVAPVTAADVIRSRFHAMAGDCARSATFNGRKLSPQQFKVLLISGHAVACNQESELISGLEHELVDIRESTTSMSGPRLLSAVEYVRAWGEGRNVRWTEPKTFSTT